MKISSRWEVSLERRWGAGRARKVLVLLMGLVFWSWTMSPTLNWLSGSWAWYFFFFLKRLLYFGWMATLTTSTATVLSLLEHTTFPCIVFIAFIWGTEHGGAHWGLATPELGFVRRFEPWAWPFRKGVESFGGSWRSHISYPFLPITVCTLFLCTSCFISFITLPLSYISFLVTQHIDGPKAQTINTLFANKKNKIGLYVQPKKCFSYKYIHVKKLFHNSYYPLIIYLNLIELDTSL